MSPDMLRGRKRFTADLKDAIAASQVRQEQSTDATFIPSLSLYYNVLTQALLMIVVYPQIFVEVKTVKLLSVLYAIMQGSISHRSPLLQRPVCYESC